jgi:Prolyl oligopeptidase family
MKKSIKNLVIALIIVCYTALPTYGAEIVTLFSHGIADTWKQVHSYTKSYDKNGLVHRNERHVITTPYASFNYPDATNSFYRVNYAETSFGQKNELNRIYKAYIDTIEHFQNPQIILWGLSRGASNLLIFTGQYQPTNIKAMVLESPYYSMADVIANMMHRLNCGSLPLSYGQMIAEFIFKKYTRHGYSPAKCIEHISKDTPIFIICSQEDALVPYTSSINVYKKLIESGHKDAYLFITQKGKHAAILQGPDGDKYQYVLHAFYKKYHLPHSAAIAEKGESLLVLCQPSLDELSVFLGT